MVVVLWNCIPPCVHALQRNIAGNNVKFRSSFQSRFPHICKRHLRSYSWPNYAAARSSLSLTLALYLALTHSDSLSLSLCLSVSVSCLCAWTWKCTREQSDILLALLMHLYLIGCLCAHFWGCLLTQKGQKPYLRGFCCLSLFFTVLWFEACILFCAQAEVVSFVRFTCVLCARSTRCHDCSQTFPCTDLGLLVCAAT